LKLKKIVILSIAVSCGFGLFAQRPPRSPIPNWSYQDTRPYYFGFILGGNYMDFRVKMRDDFSLNDTLLGIRTDGTVGFTVGALASKRLHEYWSLRSTVIFSFGTRGLIYTLQETPGKPTQMTKAIESTTLDLPLELKWRGMRDRSLRPYVIGGFRYSLDMASNARKKRQADDEWDVTVKLKRDDLLFTTGVGFDFYLHYGNMIGVEIKMAFGLRDMLIHENNIFTNGINRLTSRNLQIVINIH
jgi:hypothetical protein